VYPPVFNLEGIRNALFRQLDWAPAQSTVAQDRVDEFVHRAYLRLALDAPFLFFEREITWPVHPDIAPTLATDLLKVLTDDAWVLETELTVGTTGAVVWSNDTSWEGRTIMLKDAASTTTNEIWHPNRIREIWQVGSNIRISLEKPWPNVSDTGIDWRVINNEFLFPDEMIEVRNVSLLEQTTRYPYPLEFVSQQRAEYALLPNSTTLTPSGAPRVLYRREHQQLPSPTLQPAVAASGSWTGGDVEPEGTFEYCYTYAWGHREARESLTGPELGTTNSQTTAKREPYFESAPSPVSDQITVATGGSGTAITTPNFDHMVGFWDPGATQARHGHAGIKKRIYRRRLTSDNAGSNNNVVESASKLYFLKDLDGSTETYTDIGTTIPDYYRPLRVVHGYQTFRLHPRPSQRYELVIRAICRPEPLTDPSDVPVIHQDGAELLIQRAASYLYESQGNAAMADRALRLYTEALLQVTKRYGSMRPASRPTRRAVAQVRPKWRTKAQPFVTDA
jgi:hypothetical protein